jgi:hypothetical protein
MLERLDRPGYDPQPGRGASIGHVVKRANVSAFRKCSRRAICLARRILLTAENAGCEIPVVIIYTIMSGTGIAEMSPEMKTTYFPHWKLSISPCF